MGYDLHITKAEHWVDAEQHPIMPKEWLDLVESDPELTISTDEFYDQSRKGGGIERAYATIWRSQGEIAFWFQDGEVTVKNPDDTAILKLLDIAEKLGARVVGDEGEVYSRKSSSPGWEASSEG